MDGMGVDNCLERVIIPIKRCRGEFRPFQPLRLQMVGSVGTSFLVSFLDRYDYDVVFTAVLSDIDQLWAEFHQSTNTNPLSMLLNPYTRNQLKSTQFKSTQGIPTP